MVDLQIIEKFVTHLSFYAFDPIPINFVMFGTSKTKNPNDLIEKLGKNENIYNVSYHSGNLFVIHAHLRDSNKLDPLVSFIRQVGQIPKLKVGLHSIPASSTHGESKAGQYSKLDFFIINSLKDNSRKTVADIANEVGTSTKTVRRHLNRLIEESLVNFSINWYPDKGSETIAMIILDLEPNAIINKTEFIDELHKKYSQEILFSWSFSTLPNTIIVCVWTSKMKELQELEASLRSEKVDSISVNIGIRGKLFPTWRDKYLENKIKELKEEKVLGS
jgi:DNA-binding Lrp family transcriptional regulator